MVLILSIFPGIDLLGRAFEEVWPDACVVRGPDLLWGGDIHSFHPPLGKFDGVIGGPPCQAFSPIGNFCKTAGAKHGNLIPEFERVVDEARPQWFLAENVPQAPIPQIRGYVIQNFLLNNRWVGGEQNRERRFTFGLYFSDDGFIDPAITDNPLLEIETNLFEPIESFPTVLAGHGLLKSQRAKYKVQYFSIQKMCQLQGLSSNFLDDAPFTAQKKREVIGNGVPLPMGQAIARAVRKAVEG